MQLIIEVEQGLARKGRCLLRLFDRIGNFEKLFKLSVLIVVVHNAPERLNLACFIHEIGQ